MDYEHKRAADKLLLTNLKTKLPELQGLLDEISSKWGYEDRLYRFYHQSFKVFDLQDFTMRIVESLRSIASAGQRLHPWFEEIVSQGTGIEFDSDKHNKAWPESVRPIVEAFLHAKYFLEMAVKYGAELNEPPDVLPSGWAGLLELYGIR
jgi:hypothetical protein